jgi:hypothetical protein
MEDKSKFFAGTMSALSCMVSLEVSCVNLLSKMDLVRGRKAKSEVGRYVRALSPRGDAREGVALTCLPCVTAGTWIRIHCCCRMRPTGRRTRDSPP